MQRATSGYLACGMPYNRLGVGPRTLVVFTGLSFENKPATRLEAGTLFGPFRPFARDFTVWLVGRRPRLAPGTTMADMADEYAEMVATEFGGPVDLIGTSTGGSIALQFALDHPDLVHRLVLYSAAYRLGDRGRAFQRRLATLAARGDARGVFRETMVGIAVPPVRASRLIEPPLRALFFLLSLVAPVPADVSDFIVTIEAEDAFDVRPRLGEVRAPTLVVGGGRDPFYEPELFGETARAIPRGRLLLLPHKGHVPAGPRVAGRISAFLCARRE